MTGCPAVRLWLAAVAASVLFAVAYGLGVMTESAFLRQFAGLRSTVFVVLAGLPLVAAAWGDRVAHARDWFSTTAAVLCLLIPLAVPLDRPLLWSPFYVLLWADTAAEGVLSRLMPWTWRHWMAKFRHRVSAVLLIVWAFAFFVLPGPDGLSQRVLVTCLAAAAAGYRRWWPALVEQWQIIRGDIPQAAVTDPSDKAPPSPAPERPELAAALPALALAFAVAFLVISWQEAKARQHSPAADLLDVQQWAREHTPAEARFMVPEPADWPVMSRRAAAGRVTADRDIFADVAQTGATHLVLYRTDETDALPLQRAYENARLVVYALPQPSARQTASAPAAADDPFARRFDDGTVPAAPERTSYQPQYDRRQYDRAWQR